ncbi:MAG: HU family DNA-binding protein [Paraclostridium sp.]
MGLPTMVAAEATVNVMLNTIMEKLKNGETVELYGFGKFEVVQKSARVGRNPKTGEEIKIEAKKAVKFKPAKALSEMVK